MKLRMIACALVACALLVPLTAQAQVLYATQACGRVCDPLTQTNLYTINPADGTATLVGDTGESITGLDVHPITGVLYGTTTPNSANPSSLVTIDPSDASTTVVGPHGQDIAVTDLTFTPDGTLYGWLEAGEDDVVVIDLGTGAATILSDTQLNTGGSAFDWAPDGFFYLFGECCGLPPGYNSNVVVPIEVGSGQPVDEWSLDNPGDNNFLGGSFNGDRQLYALRGLFADSPRDLVTVDLATGDVTTVGSTADWLSGLAWDTTPEQTTPIPVLSRTGLIVVIVLVGGCGVLLARRFLTG